MDYSQATQHRRIARNNKYLETGNGEIMQRVNINFAEFVKQIPNHPRPNVVHETLEDKLKRALEG